MIRGAEMAFSEPTMVQVNLKGPPQTVRTTSAYQTNHYGQIVKLSPRPKHSMIIPPAAWFKWRVLPSRGCRGLFAQEVSLGGISGRRCDEKPVGALVVPRGRRGKSRVWSHFSFHLRSVTVFLVFASFSESSRTHLFCARWKMRLESPIR